MTDPSTNAFSSLTPLKGAGLSHQATEALTNNERKSISRRLIVSLVGAALLGLGLALETFWPHQALVGQLVQALAAVTVALHTFNRALQGFFASPPTELTEQLVALAILAAFAIGDFTTAALVPLLLEIGHLLEERSALGAQAAIQGLKSLCARQARVLRDDGEVSVDPQSLAIGDKVVVRPGEVIPVDGSVSSGYSYVDQSSITGESKPEEITPGDPVFAGSVAIDGMLQIDASRVGEETAIGQVIDVLQAVEQTKTPIVRRLEQLAGYYLPAVLALACLVLFATGDFSRFITVLIVACPCALVLAAPSVMVAAMSTATRASILIKNAGFLEKAAIVDTLILDKTGTLTDGTLSVADIVACDATLDANEVLGAALVAAHGSRHPASRAIVEEAQKRGVVAASATRVLEVPGRGVKAWLGDDLIRIGRRSWLEEENVAVQKTSETSGVWVSRNDTLLGFVALKDEAKADAQATIEAMRERGFARIILLTGDKSDIAQSVGQALSLDEVIAEVLPVEKLDVVRAEQAKGHRVLMLGDGINDAPALSAADVGVAIGADMNDVALGGADVALHTASLSRLPFLIDLADQAHRTIMVNVLVGMGFSVGMLAIASMGLIDPLLGALLHNGGAIFVVLNSARLLRFRGFGPAVAELDRKKGNCTPPQGATCDSTI